jgi:hypothetical protein
MKPVWCECMLGAAQHDSYTRSCCILTTGVVAGLSAGVLCAHCYSLHGVCSEVSGYAVVGVLLALVAGVAVWSWLSQGVACGTQSRRLRALIMRQCIPTRSADAVQRLLCMNSVHTSLLHAALSLWMRTALWYRLQVHERRGPPRGASDLTW